MLTKNDVKQIGKVLDERLDKKIYPLQKDIKQMKKDLKTVINVFDIEILDMRSRLLRIEKHLDLTV